MTKLDPRQLETVTGAGVWNGVDSAISLANKGWKDKSCASRGSWIGWGVGTGLGLESAAVSAWATKKYGAKAGFWAQSVVGPANGIIGTQAYSSYVDNCEAQKAAGK